LPTDIPLAVPIPLASPPTILRVELHTSTRPTDLFCCRLARVCARTRRERPSAGFGMLSTVHQILGTPRRVRYCNWGDT
jgi:hypothetical protein